MTRLIRKLALGMGCIIIPAALVMAYHPYFHLQTITYSHTSYIAKDSLSNFSTSYYSKSAITPLLSGQFKSNFLLTFPSVESCSISFTWPNTFEVAVHEKTPWISCWVDHKSRLVSKDGTILNSGQENIDLGSFSPLIIRGIPPEHFDSSYLPDYIVTLLSEVSSTISKILPNNVFQVALSGVSVSEDFQNVDNISLFLDDTIQIKLGKYENLDQKLLALKSWLHQTNNPSDIEYIDLRVLNRVIVKYAAT